jgi:Uri superfamily endonuclease
LRGRTRLKPRPLACPGGIGRLPFVRSAAEAPALPGAYLLVVALPAPLTFTLPQRPETTLAPGRYLYAGSACGPGGLRARLARHMRAEKKPHWHIDRLTEAGTVEGAWVVPGCDECSLIASLAALPVPLPGFGSSDCRRCSSHLLEWPTGHRKASKARGSAPGPR